VGSDRAGPYEFNAAVTGDGRRFSIQIIEYLHMIRQKSYRYNCEPPGIGLADVISDIGFEPRLSGRTTAALEDENGCVGRCP
jgi:hypothetical protein